MNGLLTLAQNGAAWLGTLSWQAALILGVAWLILKLGRIHTPALRHQIWLCGLLAIFALPFCAYLPFSLPNLPTSEIIVADWSAVQQPALTTVSRAANAVNLPAKTIATPVNWWRMIASAAFLLWLIGLGIRATRIFISVGKMRRMRHNARPSTAKEMDCELTNTAHIALSAETSSPMLMGIWPPVIILPADILQWTDRAERRAMLLHEIAHLERRDYLTNAFSSILQVLFFFHPLVRLACRQLTLECELACDERVLSAGASPETYAQSILKVAERNLLTRGLQPAAFFSTKQFLERRLCMILKNNYSQSLKRSWRYLILPAGLIAALTLFLGAGNKPPVLQTIQDDDLVERAVANNDTETKLTAVRRIAQINGERGTLSLLEVYARSNDAKIKEAVLHQLGERGATSPLIALRQVETQSDLQNLLQQEITGAFDRKAIETRKKYAGSEMPPPPPPPPPPTMAPAPPSFSNENFQVVGIENRNMLEPLGFSIMHIDNKRFYKIRLPQLQAIAAQITRIDASFYLLDKFELTLKSDHTLYGTGSLRIQPKMNAIEYSLSADGAIYLDKERTQKVGLSEFLQK